MSEQQESTGVVQSFDPDHGTGEMMDNTLEEVIPFTRGDMVEGQEDPVEGDHAEYLLIKDKDKGTIRIKHVVIVKK
ncbi:MAG: hypothetical protein AAF740_09465 [Bacteroidota bacterium]